MVNFTTGLGPDINHYWEFGDSTFSFLENPSHTYFYPDVFDVSVTLIDSIGCETFIDSISFINIIPTEALFIMDTASGCAPQSVDFTDISTSANPIVSWKWDFGDGTSQIGPQNPSHFYPDTGVYTVTLIVIDAIGCIDTIDPGIDANFGQNFDVNFTVNPFTTCRVDPVNFINLSDTSAPSSVEWTWKFGDGNVDYKFNTEYQYSDTGFFDVTLRANHYGCISDTIIDSIVRIFPPVALFTPFFDCTNYLEVAFQNNSIGQDTWVWEINGDSIFTDSVTYTFPDTGDYEIHLYVQNAEFGCVDSLIDTISVVPPNLDFTNTNPIGCPPFNVTFSNLSEEAISWKWYFGDGDSSELQFPTHTYSVVGYYDVTLVTTNINGCIETVTKPQFVNALSAIPIFGADTISGCRPLTINFTDSSAVLGGNITHWFWNFGDGNTSILENPTHTYQSIGNYTVTLQIIDTTGCIGSDAKTNYINVTGPIPYFTQPADACVLNEIDFLNNSYSIGGNITNWFWDFGDGTNSTLENPSHEYLQYGNYDISLTTIDDNGCDSTLTIVNAINIDTLVANFTADTTIGSCPPFIVNFEQLASPNPTSWEWDFGNGGTSQVPNPNVIYNDVGTFNIQLIASNDAGCIDTITKQSFITSNGPVGALNSSATKGCIDLEVDFSVLSNNSLNQTWDFGDGNVITNNSLNISHTYNTINTFYPFVILEDSTGCEIPYIFDSIQTGVLAADFSIGDYYICTPDTISFTDLSSSFPQIIAWEWDFGDGNNASQQNPIHNYTSGGVFDIQLIVDNGFCKDTVEVIQQVVSDSSTSANFDFNLPPQICPPVNISFTNNSVADSTITNWNWNFGSGNLSSLQTPPSLLYDSAGLYNVSLEITTIKGCTNLYTDSLRVYEIPTFELELDSLVLCENTDTTLNLVANADFSWTPNINLSCADCPNPKITALENTDYFIHAENEFGCSFDDTLNLTVNKLPNLTVSEGETVGTGTVVNMTAFSTSAPIYNWSPNENLTCVNCTNNTFEANETTTFIVSAENEFSCLKFDSILIKVIDLCDGSSIFIPNIFTPNNDNLNDELKITILENLDIDINYFRIFDRWGNLVFETSDIKETWNGTNFKGNNLNTGVYIYTLNIVCSDGSSNTIQGNVTLLR